MMSNYDHFDFEKKNSTQNIVLDKTTKKFLSDATNHLKSLRQEIKSANIKSDEKVKIVKQINQAQETIVLVENNRSEHGRVLLEHAQNQIKKKLILCATNI